MSLADDVLRLWAAFPDPQPAIEETPTLRQRGGLEINICGQETYIADGSDEVPRTHLYLRCLACEYETHLDLRYEADSRLHFHWQDGGDSRAKYIWEMPTGEADDA